MKLSHQNAQRVALDRGRRAESPRYIQPLVSTFGTKGHSGTTPRHFAMFALSGILFLAGCAPNTEVVNPDGLALMHIKRGFCFVGCGIKARLPDGTKCGGYAVGMEYGRGLNAELYCPNRPTTYLQVDVVEKTGSSVGRLKPNASFNSQNQIDVDAVVKKYTPISEN